MPNVSISPQPKLQFFDSNGNPLSGGKLYSYDAGTTTPRPTYTDSTGTIANTNPVILDTRGEASVWLDSSLYKLVLKTASDVSVWTVDNVASAATLAQLAASGGSALIGFLQAGTGAVTRTAQSKMRDVVSVFDFMTVAQIADVRAGTASLDVTAAIQAASTAALNASVYFPSGNYKITSKITTLPYGQKWFGDGRYSSVIVKYFNGDMVDMGVACTFEDLGFSGQGSTYSGRGVVISGVGNTRQVLKNCNITDMSGYCLEITTPNAGAGLDINGGNYVRTDETLSAIRLPVDSTASPRFIRSVDTTGFLVDTNGADNTILTGNRARNMVVGSSSNKVIASGNRFSSLGLPLIVEGTQHNFTGNVLAGDLTLGASANGCIATSNLFASPFGVIDNGIAAGNIFDVAAKTYTPVWTSTGTPPVLGNGTMRGAVTKAGQSVTVNVSLLMGSTTTFGTDDWTFSLPFASNPALSAPNYGIAYFFDSGTAYKIGIVRNFAGTSVVQIFYDDAPGAVRFSRPFVWAVGDELNFSITYIC